MRTVGIRELKDRLSEYLRVVRSGEAVLVTDRGEVVAELGPPGQPRVDPAIPPGLLALARRGLATLGAADEGSAYPALPRARSRRRTVAELLEEERGPR